jgi:hypothetical protein
MQSQCSGLLGFVRFLFYAVITTICSLSAEEEPVHSLWHYHPLHVGGQILSNCKAECHRQNHSNSRKGQLRYQKASAFISMMTPISRHHIFFPQVQCSYVTLDWNRNNRFSETNFYSMQCSILYYTTALQHWKWIARFDYNLQVNYASHPGLYSLYNELVWGSCQIHRKWHYHVGALGYAGLASYDIYPIIGFDYTAGKNWFFQALFPINYSVEYHINPWTIAAKARPMKERLRTGPNESQPRSIFSYSTIGTELNIKFEKLLKGFAEIYGGYNWGGHFYVKNRYGKRPIYLAFGGAAYGGFSLDYGF